MTPRNFWKNLPVPFFVLAPMFDVTDTAFRQLLVLCGRPDVFFTEFVSIDGLLHERSQEKMRRFYLQFEEIERPLVAQIWGSDPEKFLHAAQLVAQMGFDGIDINMGCPDKKVVACGGGAGLIGDGSRAREIIAAVREGSGGLPVSVKTRLGFDEDSMEKWIGDLLAACPDALTLHGRTKKEMSKVPAHWDRIGVAAQMCHEKGVVCIGNGDVLSVEDGRQKAAYAGTEGIMVGRAVLGNPWFFASRLQEPNEAERIHTLLEHMNLFERYFSGIKNFAMLKKHFRGYISGWSGAKELRGRLMDARSGDEVRAILVAYEQSRL